MVLLDVLLEVTEAVSGPTEGFVLALDNVEEEVVPGAGDGADSVGGLFVFAMVHETFRSGCECCCG